jgi:hypothetical protein
MSQQHVELAPRAYDTFNRRDRDAFVAPMVDDVEVVTRIAQFSGESGTAIVPPSLSRWVGLRVRPEVWATRPLDSRRTRCSPRTTRLCAGASRSPSPTALADDSRGQPAVEAGRTGHATRIDHDICGRSASGDIGPRSRRTGVEAGRDRGPERANRSGRRATPGVRALKPVVRMRELVEGGQSRRVPSHRELLAHEYRGVGEAVARRSAPQLGLGVAGRAVEGPGPQVRADHLQHRPAFAEPERVPL